MLAVAGIELNVRRLGRVAYAPAFQAMRAFTSRRGPDTPDELWLLEHPPVYTLGQGAAPRRPTDSCWQAAQFRSCASTARRITHHGPQAVGVVATRVDRAGAVGRAKIPRPGVGERLRAPGVYVAGAKVAALGLRVSRGRCYHGLALNVDCDLAPFAAIDPCGLPGLAVTSTRELGIRANAASLGEELADQLMRLVERARA